jgi:hypothetical protein
MDCLPEMRNALASPSRSSGNVPGEPPVQGKSLCLHTEDRGHDAPCGHKKQDASFRIPDNMFFFDSVELDYSRSRITKYSDYYLFRNKSNESVCICQMSGFSHKSRKHFMKINASIFSERNFQTFQSVVLKNHPLDREMTLNKFFAIFAV